MSIDAGSEGGQSPGSACCCKPVGYLDAGGLDGAHLVAMVDDLAGPGHEDVVSMDEECLQRLSLPACSRSISDRWPAAWAWPGRHDRHRDRRRLLRALLTAQGSIAIGADSAEKMFLPVPAYSTSSLWASLSKCSVGSMPALVSFCAFGPR